MSEDREALRSTFDAAAHRFDEARPDYPEDLFDELVRLSGVRAGDRVVEVGCGTGKATPPAGGPGVAGHVRRTRRGARR